MDIPEPLVGWRAVKSRHGVPAQCQHALLKPTCKPNAISNVLLDYGTMIKTHERALPLALIQVMGILVEWWVEFTIKTPEAQIYDNPTLATCCKQAKSWGQAHGHERGLSASVCSWYWLAKRIAWSQFNDWWIVTTFEPHFARFCTAPPGTFSGAENRVHRFWKLQSHIQNSCLTRSS